MDIEGHEYEWLETINKEQLLKINQIVIEFHTDFEGFSKLDKNKINILKKLSDTHYLIHFHGNNYQSIITYTDKNNTINVPKVFECTYVKKSLLNNIKNNTDQIPGKLDYPNNINNPDIYLSEPPYIDI